MIPHSESANNKTQANWPWNPAQNYDGSISSTDQWPKISIITPSYNQGKYLEETILSVINQHYPNLEYMVIDGGSTDNSVEIIKKYEQYITYWVSEEDKGQSDAINKGLKQCTGEVFNWLNSDDFYTPGALLEVGKAFRDTDTNVLVGKERRINESGIEIGLSHGSSVLDTLSQSIGKCHIDQPSTFFRLPTLEPLLPLDSSFHYLMDGEMWLRYLLYWGQDKINKTDSILVNFRLHESSKTTSSYEKFQIDKNTFENNLIRKFHIDSSLKKILLGRKSRSFSKEVQINQDIDEEVITSFFCARSVVQFYEAYAYKEAKACLTYVRQHLSRKAWEEYHLDYYQKVFKLPSPAINVMRKLKKRWAV